MYKLKYVYMCDVRFSDIALQIMNTCASYLLELEHSRSMFNKKIFLSFPINYDFDTYPTFLRIPYNIFVNRSEKEISVSLFFRRD